MDPVILMVGRINEGVHDIEVMPDIPAVDLADAIALAFGWSGTYDLQIDGKMLAAHQTLAEADIWDGSRLLLVTSNRPARQTALSAKQVARHHRSLQIPDPPSQQTTSQGGVHRPLQVPIAPAARPTGESRSLQLPSETPVTQGGSPVSGKRTLQIPHQTSDPVSDSPTAGWKPIIPEPPDQTMYSSPLTGWRQTPTTSEPSKDNDSQP